MPKAYSGDLRVRVIEMVQAGASRREAAEEFSVADSTAVKWLQRWEESGSAEAKPRGGSVSPLEAHATLILEVVQAQPDATFVELLVVLKKWGIRTSRTTLRYLPKYSPDLNPIGIFSFRSRARDGFLLDTREPFT